MTFRDRGFVALLLVACLTGTAMSQTRQPAPAPATRPSTPPGVAQPSPTRPASAAPEPIQRRIAVSELGFPAGAVIGPEWQDITFPLPRDIPGLGARLSLAFDLIAPFPARHAIELAANGRLIAARAFPQGGNQLALDLPIAAEDLARGPETLHLRIRLIEQPTPAAGSAVLQSGSQLHLTWPNGTLPSTAATLRLMPPRVVVRTRSETVSAAEAAAALRTSLALSAAGREVRIASGPPPASGGRVWETGTVLIGTGNAGLSVVNVAGMPAIALGGDDPESATRLLEASLRPGAASPVADHTGALPFSALRGALPALESAEGVWNLEFSTRDLPAGTRAQALQVELNGPPDSRAAASVFLNDVLLGSATTPSDGRLRLPLRIPEPLIALDNRVGVTLHRAAAGAPVQLLPSSALLLGPAGMAAEFVDLPPLFAGGLEVLIEGRGGVGIEALNLPLWILRTLVPPRTPIAITVVEPGTAPHPRGAFLAITAEPPAASAPRLRVLDGRLEPTSRGSRMPAPLPATSSTFVAQLLDADGQPGIWLRQLNAADTPNLDFAVVPRLERGDVALLDERGVTFAWASTPRMIATPLTRAEPIEEGSTLLAWRTWIAAALWLAGFALTAYAFARPRRAELPS